MTDKNISIWKVEEFLIGNLKELPKGNGKYMLKAEFFKSNPFKIKKHEQERN